MLFVVDLLIFFINLTHVCFHFWRSRKSMQSQLSQVQMMQQLLIRMLPHPNLKVKLSSQWRTDRINKAQSLSTIHSTH